MNGNLYLTEMKTGPFKREDNKTEGSDIHSFLLPETFVDSHKEPELASRFLIKNKDLFEKTTSAMMDYLFKEETNFLDLKNIEKYFFKQSIKNSTIVNEKDLDIQKKRKELLNIELQINQKIIKAVKLDTEKPKQTFEPILKELTESLENATHDFKSYETIKKSIYDDGILLKNRLSEALTWTEINDKQFDKYKTIKHNAEMTYNLQKSIITHMKKFEVRSSQKYTKVVENKKVICSNLEHELSHTKSKIVSMQASLDNLKEEILDQADKICIIKEKNEKSWNDHKEKLRDYLREQIRLHQIYQTLKVHDIDSIISQFKDELIHYKGNNTLYYNLNKEISKLNAELSAKQNDLKKTISNIKESEINLAEEEIQALSKEFKVSSERNKQLQQSTSELEQFVSRLTIFIVKYHKVLTDKMNRLNNVFKKEDSKKCILESCGIIEEWTPDNYRAFVKCSQVFQRKILFVYSNFIMSIVTNFYSSKKMPSVFILGFRSDKVAKIVQDSICASDHQFQERLKLKMKEERNLIREKTHSLEKKKMKDMYEIKKTTMKDVFDNFLDNARSNLNPAEAETIENFIGVMDYKFYKTMSHYTNEFVDKTTEDKKPLQNKGLKAKKKPLATPGKSVLGEIISKDPRASQLSSLFLERKSITASTSPERKAKLNFSTLFTEEGSSSPVKDDSYISIKEEKDDGSRNKKEKNYFGYNKKNGKDVQLLYTRINDLNKLEVEFLHNKHRSVNQNQYFYKFSGLNYNNKKNFVSDNKSSSATLKYFKPLPISEDCLSDTPALTSGYAHASTRFDTQSNYAPALTEPNTMKNNENRSNKKAVFRESLNEVYLLDRERKIDTRSGKRNNTGSIFKLSQYQRLPSVFNNLKNMERPSKIIKLNKF